MGIDGHDSAMSPAVAVRFATVTFATVALCSIAAPSTAAADSEAKALKLSQQALKNYMLERYEQAAQLYRQAWLNHHSQHVYLYNAARAAQRAGKFDDAERDYTLFLRNAPRTSPERPKAAKHVQEVRAELARRRPKAKPTPRPPPRRHVRTKRFNRTPKRKPDPAPNGSPGAGKRALGWVLAVAGGAATIGGGVLLLQVNSRQTELDQKKSKRDENGKIVLIGFEEARAEQNAINSSLYRAYGVTGVGLAALGVGAYLVASTPSSSVSLAPAFGGRGLLVAVEF